MNKENIRVFALTYTPNINAIIPNIAYIKHTLEDMQKIIGCDCVTCTEVLVAGKIYDVWSDDEALLKENPVPNLYINDDLIIFGNLIFAKHDEYGETIDLTVADIRLLETFIRKQFKKLQKYFGRKK